MIMCLCFVTIDHGLDDRGSIASWGKTYFAPSKYPDVFCGKKETLIQCMSTVCPGGKVTEA